ANSQPSRPRIGPAGVTSLVGTFDKHRGGPAMHRTISPRDTGRVSAFVRRLYDFQDDMSWSVRRTTVSTTSNTYVDLASASTTVVVPDGAWANISARFAAESTVIGAAGTWGTVRLMISRNGAPFEEMSPGQGTDAAFDSAGAGADWEAHALERLAEGPGGTYTVKAQYAVTGASNFALDDYSLVVETDLQ